MSPFMRGRAEDICWGKWGSLEPHGEDVLVLSGSPDMAFALECQAPSTKDFKLTL